MKKTVPLFSTLLWPVASTSAQIKSIDISIFAMD